MKGAVLRFTHQMSRESQEGVTEIARGRLQRKIQRSLPSAGFSENWETLKRFPPPYFFFLNASLLPAMEKYGHVNKKSRDQ